MPVFDLLICCSQNDTSRSSCALDFIQLFGRAKIILFLNFFTMTLFCYNLYHLIWMVLELFGLHLWNLKGYKYSLLNLLVLIILQWVNWTPSPQICPTVSSRFPKLVPQFHLRPQTFKLFIWHYTKLELSWQPKTTKKSTKTSKNMILGGRPPR